MRVVLHTPALGALELRLALHGGALGVDVVADAAVAAAASGALPELREAVLSSTGLVPRVEVVERRGAAPPADRRARERGAALWLSRAGRSRRR